MPNAKSFVIALILIVLLSGFPGGLYASSGVHNPNPRKETPVYSDALTSTPTLTQLTRLANVVVSRFNSSIGLVYESIKGQDTYSNKSFSETYWLENDNGQAAWALAPYSNSVSQYINQTLQKYQSEYNLPKNATFSQVFWGAQLPGILNGSNIAVNVSSSYSVVDEIHTGVPINYSQYENTLVIHSISNYLKGNVTGALKDFYLALGTWNGTGIVDGTTKSDGAYSDYKLAYLIYDAHLLNFWNSTLTKIENSLWAHQLPWGGIPTFYGGKYPTAGLNASNTETATITLLAYDYPLISKVRALQYSYHYLNVTTPLGNATGTGWYQAKTNETFGLTPSNISCGSGCIENFTGWTGSGNGSYSGSGIARNATLNSDVNETANWHEELAANITLNSEKGNYNISASNFFAISYSQNGNPEASKDSGPPTTVWADPGTPVTFGGRSSGSNASDEWCLNSSCNATMIPMSNSSSTTSYYYYNLLSQSVSEKILPSGAPAIPFTYLGAPPSSGPNNYLNNYSIALSAAKQTIWVQKSSNVTLPAIFNGTLGERWIIQASFSQTIQYSNQITNPAMYAHQYQVVIIPSPSAAGKVSPMGGWFEAGSSVPIAVTKTASSYMFLSWNASSASITTANSHAKNTRAVINGPGTIAAIFGLNLKMTPISIKVSVAHGGFAKFTAVITGPTQLVTLSNGTVPKGITISFATNPVSDSTAGKKDLITISASSAVKANTYTIQIRATGATGVVYTIILHLTVT